MALKWRLQELIPKMGKAIWMVLFVFLVVTSVQTDNVRHAQGTGKELAKVFSGDVWKYLSNWEQSSTRRFEQIESRLTRNLDERIQQVNQSASIALVEKLLHNLNEELSVNRVQMERSDSQVEELRRRTEDQQAEIDDLKKTIAELQVTVASLLAIGHTPLEFGKDEGKNTAAVLTTSSTPETTALRLPVDCQDAFDRKVLDAADFYYPLIKPRLALEQFKVCCFANQSTGWTVIQRRVDGSLDFYRNWSDYKTGFGDVKGEFWMGNDRIYQLTNQGDYRLRIEMLTWDDESYWAEYRHFRISDEADKYRLHVTGYRGNAGNSLSSAWDNDHNGQPFSTHDNDNDERFYDNCAEHFHGAWWFRSCFQSHLNGIYYPQDSHSNFFVRDGIQWNSIHPHSSLREVKMMVRTHRVDHRLSNGLEPDA